MYREDGSTATLIIRRLRCRKCGRIHHELPDSIVPYKRYDADAIETKLTDKYSAEDVLKLTKNIYRVNSGDNNGFKVSAIQKKTGSVLDTLDVDSLRKI